jgi:predicted Zn-dependent peptidase
MPRTRPGKATLVAMLLGAAVTPAGAQQYAPRDLYAYEALTLENGLHVILNRRGESPNVALRLVVDTGLNQFPCEKRELPHLVEHLMFSGYDDLSESDLDHLIADWGGWWNAFTKSDRTTYEAQVYSGFLDDLTRLLTSMFSRTQLTPDELESARAIVRAEAGGVPGPLRRLLYKMGIYEGNEERAYRRFVQGSNEWCETLVDAGSISLSEVETFMDTEHDPARLTLIVVGLFDVAHYKDTLARTLGTLPRYSTNRSPASNPRSAVRFVATDYKTRTDIPLGQEGYVSLEFGLPVWTSRERPALVLIGNYLQTRMFETLRTEMGLSYDPDAAINDFDGFSTLMLDATVATQDMDVAMQAMEDLVVALREDGIPESVLDRLKRSMLYSTASAYESNTAVADFYESGLPVLRALGAFPDLNTFYGNVTTEDTLTAARAYLDLGRALRYTSKPTLSYGGVLGLVALPFVVVAALRLLRRRPRAGASSRTHRS